MLVDRQKRDRLIAILSSIHTSGREIMDGQDDTDAYSSMRGSN